MRIVTDEPDPVREKFRRTRQELGGALVEREGEVDVVLTALVCSEHALLVGEPGTAKSLLLDALLRWAGGRLSSDDYFSLSAAIRIPFFRRSVGAGIIALSGP